MGTVPHMSNTSKTKRAAEPRNLVMRNKLTGLYYGRGIHFAVSDAGCADRLSATEAAVVRYSYDNCETVVMK